MDRTRSLHEFVHFRVRRLIHATPRQEKPKPSQALYPLFFFPLLLSFQTFNFMKKRNPFLSHPKNLFSPSIHICIYIKYFFSSLFLSLYSLICQNSPWHEHELKDFISFFSLFSPDHITHDGIHAYTDLKSITWRELAGYIHTYMYKIKNPKAKGL